MNQYRSMNEAGVKQYPYPFEIKILWKHVRIYGDIAWVECDSEWIQKAGSKTSKDVLRLTTIFKYQEGIWKVKHVHGSEPDYRLKAGEYMLDHTVVERNRELERQVFERTKELEEEKKRTVEKSRELEQALIHLRNTQKQLVHSEKMASLAILTSGIAHELKNPLNFVNNFAQVSKGLMQDFKNENKEDEKKAILNDITENLEKISHHGKRADSIVTNMIAHSHIDNMAKTNCNIKQLIEEALTISTLNERSKNENFTCDIKTSFDAAVPLISVVHQEFSLVILNIIYNAFYSINEKRRKEGPDYKPQVIIHTKMKKNNLAISIKDNGLGMPDDIKEKIFEPFFTTKPAGQGTGLGLSLSYDIITNGHAGTIEVNNSLKNETEFIISIPV